jgi:hypothetical protein
MRWGFLFVVTVVALAACGGQGSSPAPSPTPTPSSATAQPAPTPETAITITPIPTETTTPVEPTPEVADEYEGWLTYTNDVYGYEFRYPPEAEVWEAPLELFSLPREEYEAGVTFQDVYQRYTGKVCINVRYGPGGISILASADESSLYINCGRTSRAYEGPDRQETLIIDGGTYTARGFEEQGPGEILNYHNETLHVYLEDGTRIEYGSWASETATFEDYLQIRDQLLKIVQSYRKLP